ncbi:putative WD repeat-containing protein C2E1P5.05 [Pseudocercospora fuligena]|uniref:Putative WD repeat-containing protein C2E1P5.05 n=1 Tax=Pseudocercospora fuligena TaxID=685502 RepID=A0A8H6RAC2_9PEZI|nr:putative WD repeat-containing protein C2E1P5.05 [Pseudocercospora fuligena]
MSSFFTKPASQVKRKRAVNDAPARPPKRAATQSARKVRDESISGSDDEDDEGQARGGGEDFFRGESEDDELEGLDPAARRIALAERYLESTRQQVIDEAGFDAAEIDKELLAERMGDRLKEETAETRGKIYRWISQDFDWAKAGRAQFRHHQKAVTGVAIAGDYAYTVGNDMILVKWRLPAVDLEPGRSRKPQKVAVSRSFGKRRDEKEMHTKAIRCVAASQDGKFVATGGLDKKLIVWDAATLKPLKVFSYNSHRDSVESLAFRRGTNQLFSAGRDRNVKIWSLDELTYVDTLYGHQDSVVDVSALAQEKCVTVGARDRTARLWKVVEESQLVFRGGGAPKTKSKSTPNDSAVDLLDNDPAHEGSMDRIACLDDENFITGSDNGSLSLWNIHKKKPVFTYPLAHGIDPPLPLTKLSAEEEPPEDARNKPTPRWITALRAIPFSDIFVTGSWDGYVRVWKITSDKRRIELLGRLGRIDSSVDNLLDEFGVSAGALTNSALQDITDATQKQGLVEGIINDLAIEDRGERAKDGIIVIAAVGKEHRLGRWREFEDGKNYSVLFEVPRKVLEKEHDDSSSDAAFHSAKEDVDS